MRDDYVSRTASGDHADDASGFHPNDHDRHGLVAPPEPVRPWRIVLFGGVGAVVLGVTFAMLVPRGLPGAPDTEWASRRTASAAAAPGPEFRPINGRYAAPNRDRILAAYVEVAKVNNAEGVGAVARASMDCFQKLARQPDYGLMDYCLALDAFGAETYAREAGDAAPPSTYFGQGPVRRQRAVQGLTAGQTDANARLLDTNRLIQEISLAKPDVPPPPPPPPPQPVAVAVPPPVVATPPAPPPTMRVAEVQQSPKPVAPPAPVAPPPSPKPAPPAVIAMVPPPRPAPIARPAEPPKPVQTRIAAPPPKPARPLLIAKAEPAPKPAKRLAQMKPVKIAPVARTRLVKPMLKAPPPKPVASPRKPLVVAEARRLAKPARPAPPPKLVKPPAIIVKARPQHQEYSAQVLDPSPQPLHLVVAKQPEKPAPTCGGRTRAERMLCEEPALQVADRRMNAAYRRALDQAQNPKALAAEQNRWLAQRDELAPDRAAVASAYQARIAELRRKGE